MSTETEIAQLQAGMAALEAQRAILGDAVVEAALSALRAKLAALPAQRNHRKTNKKGKEKEERLRV